MFLQQLVSELQKVPEPDVDITQAETEAAGMTEITSLSGLDAADRIFRTEFHAEKPRLMVDLILMERAILPLKHFKPESLDSEEDFI